MSKLFRFVRVTWCRLVGRYRRHRDLEGEWDSVYGLNRQWQGRQMASAAKRNGITGWRFIQTLDISPEAQLALRRVYERNAALNQLAREARDLGLYDNTGIPDGGSDK